MKTQNTKTKKTQKPLAPEPTAEWWETCAARASDEFEGCESDATIIQVQLASEGDASEVFGWFVNQDIADRVCALLNAEDGFVAPSDL